MLPLTYSGYWRLAGLFLMLAVLVGAVMPAIWLWPDRLTAYSLTTTDVMNAIREQNVATAAGTIGGQPNSGEVNLTYPVSAEGRLKTAEEFAQIIVRANADGSMVRLRDVARVELGAKAYTLDSRLDGGPLSAGTVEHPCHPAADGRGSAGSGMDHLTDDL